MFCGLTAVIAGYFQLLIFRVFGMGEGPMGTTTNKAITNWFPREEAGRALGFTNCGQPLGAALAGPVVGLVAFISAGVCRSWLSRCWAPCGCWRG